MAETLIRPAGPQDVDAIVALHRAFHAMHVTLDPLRWTTFTPPVAVYPIWLRELMFDEKSGLVAVAEREGQIVGYAIAERVVESARHWTPESIYFHDLYVAPPARRGGVATRLTEFAIQWRDRHAPDLPLCLTTAAKNEEARRFFARLGFRAAAVEMIAEPSSLPGDVQLPGDVRP